MACGELTGGGGKASNIGKNAMEMVQEIL